MKLYIYADDMALTATSKRDILEMLDKLTLWANQNELTINQAKLVGMIFRKEGAEDTLLLRGQPLHTLNSFKYLSMAFETTRFTYSKNIKEKE
mgnify:CR=1 FL=1